MYSKDIFNVCKDTPNLLNDTCNVCSNTLMPTLWSMHLRFDKMIRVFYFEYIFNSNPYLMAKSSMFLFYSYEYIKSNTGDEYVEAYFDGTS